MQEVRRESPLLVLGRLDDDFGANRSDAGLVLSCPEVLLDRVVGALEEHFDALDDVSVHSFADHLPVRLLARLLPLAPLKHAAD